MKHQKVLPKRYRSIFKQVLREFADGCGEDGKRPLIRITKANNKRNNQQ